MDLAGQPQAEPSGSDFRSAWALISDAEAHRSALISSWNELRSERMFRSRLYASAGRGQVIVEAKWKAEPLREAEARVAQLTSSLREALDIGVLATAQTLAGVPASEAELYRFPFTHEPDELRALLAAGHFRGLRPDQLDIIEQFQPYALEGSSGPYAQLRQLVAHLHAAIDGRRLVTGGALAIWTHSADPLVRRASDGLEVACLAGPDAALVDSVEVGSFELGDLDIVDLQANPQCAFDLILNAPPAPSHPDDNLGRRSSLLIATAREFLRSFERSLGQRPPLRGPRPSFSDALPIEHAEGWGELSLKDRRHRKVAKQVRQSETGVALSIGPDGERLALVVDGDIVRARVISPPSTIDPDVERGIAAEDAVLGGAAYWGLPDFVMRPATIRKGAATREVGDGTIVVGDVGLAIQVKCREGIPGGEDRERGWLQKKMNEGASQAAGTVRQLRREAALLLNGRDRRIHCAGDHLEWVRVVIIDHPDPPAVVPEWKRASNLPVVAITRHDWEFLFDQLRSTSAVAAYLRRVAAEDVEPLGQEVLRYFDLARADAASPRKTAPEWIGAYGGVHFTHPVLPLAPASSVDTFGHEVYRQMLEDIAESTTDQPENRRLDVLAKLDRFFVTDRAALGRLLLNHLDKVTAAPNGETMWQFRRVIQDEGGLHLAFAACSHYTEIHRDLFSMWVQLRHQETLGRVRPDGDMSTVAVMLTPRYRSGRLWDTSMVSIEGDLGLDEAELSRIRKIFPTGQSECL